MKQLRDWFISDSTILSLVAINTAILVAIYCPGSPRWLYFADDILTSLFVIEMCIKLGLWGWAEYWKSNWNRLDFLITILSIPSLITLFLAANGALGGISLVMVFKTLRIIRILKSFRLIKFIPGISGIISGVKRGLKASYFVILCFTIFLFVTAMISCGLFGKAAPEYFGNPFKSIYTIFQIFSIEGWYEIPNVVAEGMNNEGAAIFVKVYFVILLFAGGMLGMSFVNSIIVDAMAEDNNEDIKKELVEMKQMLKELQEKLKTE